MSNVILVAVAYSLYLLASFYMILKASTKDTPHRTLADTILLSIITIGIFAGSFYIAKHSPEISKGILVPSIATTLAIISAYVGGRTRSAKMATWAMAIWFVLSVLVFIEITAWSWENDGIALIKAASGEDIYKIANILAMAVLSKYLAIAVAMLVILTAVEDVIDIRMGAADRAAIISVTVMAYALADMLGTWMLSPLFAMATVYLHRIERSDLLKIWAISNTIIGIVPVLILIGYGI